MRRHLDTQAQRALMLPRRQFTPRTKRSVVHGAFLLLMIGVAAYGRTSAGADRTTLLYALVSGVEDHQGPLDKTAYAQTNTVGIGGARLVSTDSGTDNINFNDPETQIDPTVVQGSAVVAPLSPLTTVAPDQSENEDADQSNTPSAPQAQIYAVADGDTIASIAAHFNISTNTILWANGLQANDVIKAGDRLIVPPTTGVLHKVKRGDTLGEIAQLYHVKATDIQDYNHLASAGDLKINQQIMVPDAQLPDPTPAPHLAQQTEVAPVLPPATDTSEPADTKSQVATGHLQWPAPSSHDISQGFHRGHTGVDIDKDGGTTIVAALPGVVQFTGWLGGYGNFTIIQHSNGLVTRYGHQAKFLVSPGQKVAAGQPIGIVGTTGHSTGYHLHFEVLKNGKFTNPLSYF